MGDDPRAGVCVPAQEPDQKPRSALPPTAFGTDNGHSTSAAGTAPVPPHLPFAIPAGIGSIGWRLCENTGVQSARRKSFSVSSCLKKIVLWPRSEKAQQRK